MILSQENNHLEKDVENKGETEMAYRNNSLSTGGSSDYHDVIFECNNSDTFKTLVTFTDDAYAPSESSPGIFQEPCNYICVKNVGLATVEIAYSAQGITAGGPDAAGGTDIQVRQLLPVGEEIVLNSHIIGYSNTTSAANGSAVTALDVAAASAVNLTTIGSAVSSTTATEIVLADGAYHRIGDIIKIDNEILQITERPVDGIHTIDVVRGLFGTTAATHSDGSNVTLLVGNEVGDFVNGTPAEKPITSINGSFKCSNFYGKGRNATGILDGIVPGSCAWVFYSEGGFQDVGLQRHVTHRTHSGLSAATSYAFTLTADGGSAADLSFKTDATDLSMGAVVRKIQLAINDSVNSSGSNLEGKEILVSIINGDIRFRRASNIKTAAVALGVTSSSTTSLWGVGVFPASGSIKAAITKQLQSKEKLVKHGGRTEYNTADIFYDDGRGNIFNERMGQVGKIDYYSGAHSFTRAPSYAHFIAYANELSGLSASSLRSNNSLINIRARSVNQLRDAKVRIVTADRARPFSPQTV